ncbi:MAG: hypothetical protein HRT45_19760, partial [Bdellovibrionales bacterium]|nr:hypothetical protein [Bdellovibrionales bacterium]
MSTDFTSSASKAFHNLGRDIKSQPIAQCMLIVLSLYLIFSAVNSTLQLIVKQEPIGLFDYLYLLTPLTLSFFTWELCRNQPWRELNVTSVALVVFLSLLSAAPRAIDVSDYDLWGDESDQILRSIRPSTDGLAKEAAIIQMPPTELHRINSDHAIFGYSIMTYRWYYFVLGSLAPVLIFLLAVQLTKSFAWSLLPYFTLTALPIAINLANETRPYSSGLFLMLITMIFFVNQLKSAAYEKTSLALSLLLFLQSICLHSQVTLTSLVLIAAILILFGHNKAKYLFLNWRNWIAVTISVPAFIHILTTARETGLLTTKPLGSTNQENFFSLLSSAL